MKEKEKFDFNDILIKPAKVSNIESRKEIEPFHNGFLPLITAPMDTVIDKNNFKIFENLKIIPCTPRGEAWIGGKCFTSFSLNEIDEMIVQNRQLKFSERNGYYLIDIANGHMSKMVDSIQKFKKMCPSSKLMVGNVASPETYVSLSKAGADYVRIGIGNGGGCFLENSLVITDNGEKLIQDIVIGDVVLTHTGEYKNVVSTLQYPSRESLIKINDTFSTKNHEYYVLNRKYEEIVNDDNIHDYAEWVEADKLTDEYFLLEMD